MPVLFAALVLLLLLIASILERRMSERTKLPRSVLLRDAGSGRCAPRRARVVDAILGKTQRRRARYNSAATSSLVNVCMSSPTQQSVPRMPTDEGDFWRLSVDRYERMVAAGIIAPDDRVELLEGVLVNKKSKSPEHVLGTILVNDALRALLPAAWSIRSEQPVRMDDSEPEPDAAVIRGPARNYAARHPIPAEVSIIVEVADSSLRRDREDKRRIYARNGIEVYWIVNVADRLIDVFTDPSGPVLTPDYATTATYRPGDAVPVFIAGTAVGTVNVNDLLP